MSHAPPRFENWARRQYRRWRGREGSAAWFRRPPSLRQWLAHHARRVVEFCVSPRLLRWAAPIRTFRHRRGWRPLRMPLDQARRILVIRPDEIGDLILTSPFLRELRRAAPHARICLLVKNGFSDLFDACPYVDEVRRMSFGAAVRVTWEACRLRWFRFGRRGFDLVLLPRADFDAYNSRLAGHLLAGRGAMIAHENSLTALRPKLPMFSLEIFHEAEYEHEALVPLRLLERLGGPAARETRLELWPTDEDRRAAQADVVGLLPSARKLIVLHPSGGRSPLKQWPVAGFQELLRRLKAETDCSVLIIGGADEGWIAQAFAAEAGDRVALAVGRFPLRRLGAILQEADLFVGGDSGPMHMAAAAGIPVVAVFGPTSEVRFGPYGPECRVVSLRYPCSPDVIGSHEDRCSTCRFAEPRCLTELSAGAVFAEVRRALASPAQRVYAS